MATSDSASNPILDPTTLDTAPKKAGFFLTLFAVGMMILNAGLSFISLAATEQELNASAIIGDICARALMFPLIVVALFQISERFRNPRSQAKILLWTSVVVFVSIISSFASLAEQ